MKKTAKGHVSHERWLVFYVDFITLLFAFFVVLYATSKADLKKQARVASSIDSAFRALGVFQTQPEIDPNKAPDHPDGPMSPTNIVMGDQLLASPPTRQRSVSGPLRCCKSCLPPSASANSR